MEQLLKQIIGDIGSFRNEILGEVTGLKADVNDLKGQVAGLRDEITGVNLRVTALEEEGKILRKEIVGVKGELAGFKSEFTSLKGEFTSLKGELTGLKGEFYCFREHVTTALHEHGKRIENVEVAVYGMREEHGVMLRALLEGKEIQRGEIDTLQNHSALLEGTIKRAANQVLEDLKKAK